MCQFFSCVSDGYGYVMYFDAEMRKKIINKPANYQETDSHTSIAHHYGFRGRAEDKLNKYEYNPLTGKFAVDQLNTTDDSKQVRRFCNSLDFSTVVPELVIKDIINPLTNVVASEVTEQVKELLKQWASVRDSAWPSVWDSVRDSVGASVRDSVWASVRWAVWDSVWDSVRDSVWASVWDSVGASVRWAVWNSVWDSVRVYISSFFNLPNWKYIKHKEGENPFQPCIDLWERGFVPSFDGKIWRLHAGPKAEIIYEWRKENA